MLITMFTDISIISGTGAYAVWAKESGEAYRKSGIFKEPMNDSNVAEVCGIINGLHFVVNTIKPPQGSRIIAESDSETAIRVLQGSNRNALFEGLPERRNTILAGRGITVIYTHVKGHRGNSTPRNAVNSWCDRACREALRNHHAAMATAK